MKLFNLYLHNDWFVVASQQQSSQKPATAVAAVEPFEHKPLEGSKGSVGLPTKPQEIDIKLVERNGGSGQSSPSVSGESLMELSIWNFA